MPGAGSRTRALGTTLGPALCGAVLAVMSVPAAGQDLASSVPPGGEALEFSIGQRLEWRDGDRSAATTLDLGYRSQTRTQLFEIAAETRIDWAARDAAGRTGPVALPGVTLSYARDGQSSALALEAVWRRQDLTVLDPLNLLSLEGPVSIDDLTRLFDEGTRIDRGVSLAYTIGQGGPVRSTLSLGVSDVSYTGFSATAQVPEARQTLDIGLDTALDISAASTLTVGLGWQALEVEGTDRRVTRSLDLGYVIDRPLGDVRFTLAHADSPDGGRTSLSAGRSLAFPTGTLDASLGVSRDTAGTFSITGTLGLERDFRTGSFSLDVERGLRTGPDGEVLTTSLAADYSRTVTRDLSLSTDASWLRVEETGGGDTAETARLGASVGYALTRDWQASLGASYTLRDSAATGQDSSQAVFVGIERSFAIRP